MAYRSEARGAFLGSRPKTRTVTVETDDGPFVVVLCAPPENRTFELFDQMNDGKRAQIDVAAELLCTMAHTPRLNADGEPDLNEKGNASPDSPMFAFETDHESMLEQPVGSPLGELLAKELLTSLGKSSGTAASGGGSESPSKPDETSEKSTSGLSTE